jgi:hypothetical protein
MYRAGARLSWIPFVLLLGAAPLAAEDVPIGQIVVTIDPDKDLIGTRPGWSGLSGVRCGESLRRTPLDSQKFTDAEVIGLAKQAGRFVPPVLGKPDAGAILVTLDGVSKNVPVAAYTEQLNGIESFLNQFGASLREEAQDLGVVARLRTAGRCNSFSLPTLKPNPIDWTVRAERPDFDWRIENPLARQVLEGGRVWEAVKPAPRGRTRQDVSLWFNSRGPVWLETGRVHSLRTSGRRQAFTIPQPVGRLGEDIFSTSFRSSRVLVSAPGGPTVALQKPSFFLPCGNGAAEGVCGDEPGCPDVPPGTSEHPAPPEFDESMGGDKTDCLRQGDFLLNLRPWANCVSKNGGFGSWFGAESCIVISSENLGTDGDFSWHDRLSMDSSMTIFKVPITLVELKAAAQFTTKDGASTHGPELKGLVAQVGSGKTCCKPIQGPTAKIPIWGPLMLVISSTLDIQIDASDLSVSASEPAPGCEKGEKEVLAIRGRVEASSSAHLKAFLSAYVAKAGVDGELTFSDDVLEGQITTVADTGNNRLVVAPQVTYDIERFKGAVSAFVEVDLFVKSKKWEIEIANWTGYQDHKVLADKPREVSAAIGAEATNDCSQPGS